MQAKHTNLCFLLTSWLLLSLTLAPQAFGAAHLDFFVRVSDQQIDAPELGKAFKLETGKSDCNGTDIREFCDVPWFLNIYGGEQKKELLSSKHLDNFLEYYELAFGPWYLGDRMLLSIEGPRQAHIYDVENDKLTVVSSHAEAGGVDSQSGLMGSPKFMGNGRYVAGSLVDGCGFVVDISDLDNPIEVPAFYGIKPSRMASEYPELQRELYLIAYSDPDTWQAFYFECGHSSDPVELKGFFGRTLERMQHSENETSGFQPWSQKLAMFEVEAYSGGIAILSRYVVFRQMLGDAKKQYVVFDFGETRLWEVPYTADSSPQETIAHYFIRKGLERYKSKNFAESASLLRKAVEIAPLNAEGHYNLARALIMHGKEHLGKEHLERASELDPRIVDKAKHEPVFKKR